MLPDLWRMADRRVRTAPKRAAWELLGEVDEPTREVMRGIDHHLDEDEWFHDAPVFVEGERATIAALKSARSTAKKLTLFAHPLWEMCLDGALVRRLGADAVRSEVARGFTLSPEATQRAAHAHHFAHTDDGDTYKPEFEAQLTSITTALSTGPWIAAYASPEGLVRALAGMRRRFHLPPFPDDERDTIAAAIATLTALADRGVEEILTTRIAA